jgi:hypothetical protein
MPRWPSAAGVTIVIEAPVSMSRFRLRPLPGAASTRK